MLLGGAQPMAGPLKLCIQRQALVVTQPFLREADCLGDRERNERRVQPDGPGVRETQADRPGKPDARAAEQSRIRRVRRRQGMSVRLPPVVHSLPVDQTARRCESLRGEMLAEARQLRESSLEGRNRDERSATLVALHNAGK